MSQENNRVRESEGIEDIDAGASEAERDVRISADEGDDLPMTPPDMQPRGSEAAMAGDADADESIDVRIAQEEPDPNSAYGAPDDEGGLDREPRVGGDDPDSIPAREDVLGGSVYGDSAPQYGDGDDEPAEVAAMHVEGDIEGDMEGDIEGDMEGDIEGDMEGDIDELVEDDS